MYSNATHCTELSKLQVDMFEKHASQICIEYEVIFYLFIKLKSVDKIEAESLLNDNVE